MGMQAAMEILEQSLSKAPLALAAAKAAVDDGFEVPLLKGRIRGESTKGPGLRACTLTPPFQHQRPAGSPQSLCREEKTQF